MLELDLKKYLGPVDLEAENWNQYFCQTCKGSGISSDRFYIEGICRDCFGRGEKPALVRPQIRTEMKTLHTDRYGLSYIAALFHRFSDGKAALFFLYDDLIWRENQEFEKANCFFRSRKQAEEILARVS